MQSSGQSPASDHTYSHALRPASQHLPAHSSGRPGGFPFALAASASRTLVDDAEDDAFVRARGALPRLPLPPGCVRYQLAPTDSWVSLSIQLGISERALRRLNHQATAGLADGAGALHASLGGSSEIFIPRDAAARLGLDSTNDDAAPSDPKRVSRQQHEEAQCVEVPALFPLIRASHPPNGWCLPLRNRRC